MKCHEKLDRVIHLEEDAPQSLVVRFQFFLHTLFCTHCRQTMEQYEDSRELMKTAFFYDAPDMSETIMAQVLKEENVPEDLEIHEWVSFKKWVIAGCIILVSLVSAFFGFNFKEVAASRDSSYMLSIGLMIGLIVSIYGSLFIGTQLKQLRHFLGRRD